MTREEPTTFIRLYTLHTLTRDTLCARAGPRVSRDPRQRFRGGHVPSQGSMFQDFSHKCGPHRASRKAMIHFRITHTVGAVRAQGLRVARPCTTFYSCVARVPGRNSVRTRVCTTRACATRALCCGDSALGSLGSTSLSLQCISDGAQSHVPCLLPGSLSINESLEHVSVPLILG